MFAFVHSLHLQNIPGNPQYQYKLKSKIKSYLIKSNLKSNCLCSLSKPPEYSRQSPAGKARN